MDISTERVLAVGFGVLTCEDLGQAKIRSAINGKNKGAEVAKACVRMIAIKNLSGFE